MEQFPFLLCVAESEDLENEVLLLSIIGFVVVIVVQTMAEWERLRGGLSKSKAERR